MQTAVEYIFEQLEEQGLIFFNTKTKEMTISISASDYLDTKRLSKEMEKQQIERDFINGYKNADVPLNHKLLDEYYTSTYGSKESDVMTPENHIGVLSEAVKKETTSSPTEISKEEQKEKIVQIMEADAKDGLYKTEISDEEIEKESENAWSDYEYEDGNLYSTTFKGGWKLAIKWYREQLKQR